MAGDVQFKFVLPSHMRYLAVGAGTFMSRLVIFTIGLPVLGLLSFEIIVVISLLVRPFLGYN